MKQDYLTLKELEKCEKLETKEVLYHKDNYLIVQEKSSDTDKYDKVSFYETVQGTNKIFQKIASYPLKKNERVHKYEFLFDYRNNIFIPIFQGPYGRGDRQVQFALKFNFQNKTVKKVKFKNHFDAYRDILPDAIKEKVKILEYDYVDYQHFHYGNYVIFAKPYRHISSDRCDRCDRMINTENCDNYCKYQDIRKMQFVYVYDKRANEFFEIDLTGKLLLHEIGIRQVSDNLITLRYRKAQNKNASSTEFIPGRQFFNLDTRKTILDVTSNTAGLYRLEPIYYLEPIPPDMIQQVEELSNPKLFDLIINSRFLVILSNKIYIYDQEGNALMNFDFNKQSFLTFFFEKMFYHIKDLYRIPAEIWVDFLMQEREKLILCQIFSSFFKLKNTENKDVQHERILKI